MEGDTYYLLLSDTEHFIRSPVIEDRWMVTQGHFAPGEILVLQNYSISFEENPSRVVLRHTSIEWMETEGEGIVGYPEDIDANPISLLWTDMSSHFWNPIQNELDRLSIRSTMVERHTILRGYTHPMLMTEDPVFCTYQGGGLILSAYSLCLRGPHFCWKFFVLTPSAAPDGIGATKGDMVSLCDTCCLGGCHNQNHYGEYLLFLASGIKVLHKYNGNTNIDLGGIPFIADMAGIEDLDATLGRCICDTLSTMAQDGQGVPIVLECSRRSV